MQGIHPQTYAQFALTGKFMKKKVCFHALRAFVLWVDFLYTFCILCVCGYVSLQVVPLRTNKSNTGVVPPNVMLNSMPSWQLSGRPLSEEESWALSAAYHLGPGFNLVPLQGEHYADLYTFKTTNGGVISGMWNGQVSGSVAKTFILPSCLRSELKPSAYSGMIFLGSVCMCLTSTIAHILYTICA